MENTNNTLNIAVIQASPIIMDRDKTIEKAGKLIDEVSGKDVNLIVFPEAYLPCYPRGLSFGFVVGSRTDAGRDDYKTYYDNSIEVPSIYTEQLGNMAKKANAYLVMGIIERDAKNMTLYCTTLYFSPNGELVNKHRKLKPTGSERLIWGEGDGSTMKAIDTPYGVMGGLICWENYMPLARMHMYNQGVKIYILPTADSREEWQHTIKHIALEGRCYVISCNQYVTKSMYPTDLKYYDDLKNMPEEMCMGGSCVIDPLGRYVSEPVYGEETIIYASLDMGLVTKSRLDFDVCGHYSRNDVFKLIVNED